MPPKRLRRSSPHSYGLSAGERLKRAKLAGNDYLAWSWVGSEVTDPSQITQEHRLATCGFSDLNPYPFCANKYPVASKSRLAIKREEETSTTVEGELEDDIIVVSDDESPACTSKGCKSNPNCLNYLGQEKWENEEKARGAFMKAAQLGTDPTLNNRSSDTPVGLKNLGATCYANAFLQVWFQDLPFRAGVYNCLPSQDEGHKFEESPIFQLQVTFAAMQMSKEIAFNPVKLVESLKLRTTEQQDAQEFSKLFMAHLDTEFQKQSNPVLKSLIADQFQGKQVYATVCARCHKRSERESEFLELEVNLSNNAKLEDRIAALLKPEDLDGNNQYLCSKCDSLQNAKRYTELRELPAVLHFSLLRFVYDLSTMERKKSKQAIAFPISLDMDRFVKGSGANGNNRYHLRGVLLHKGPSAYHGHYEAQIFDVKNQAWFQFNDEVVTKVNTLGPHPKINAKENQEHAKLSKSQTKSKPIAAKKMAAKADSDVEVVDSINSSKSNTPPMEDENYILSKDAYMLIYARLPTVSCDEPTITNGKSAKSSAKRNGAAPDMKDPTPPDRAIEVIECLNAAHDRACKAYDEREKDAEARFREIRRRVMDIYRSWNLSSNNEESSVVSRHALEAWLSRHLSQSADKTPSEAMDIDMPIVEIPNTDIMCVHRRLDPNKASNMKRIKKIADNRIFSDDGCRFSPSFSCSDVCEQCVEGSFVERLYQVEHPRLVSLFEEVSQVGEDERAFWISKNWLKDWRQTKPRMHKASQTDPPPDDPEYDGQVRCEHGDLTPNALYRRRISLQAYELLKSVFPSWSTLSTDAEICATCETLVHISKEDRREAKIQAEEEKAKLKHMCDNALSGSTGLLDHTPCAIVPAQFVRSWKQWLFHPAEIPRPDGVDNTQFICQHGLLVLDPNCPSDIDANVTIITRKDWDMLESLYPSGPLIAIENTGNEWTHDLPVCQGCRLERKTSFDMADLTIHVLRPDDPAPTPDTYDKIIPQRQQPYQTTLLTYGSRKVGNLRQSKRIRQVRDLGRRKKVTITRTMTIKDLKITIQEDLDIPTIYQRLYYRGVELEDNAATIASLNIQANDVVDLREESEDVDFLDSDSERDGRKPDEGQGFGGTLLGSSGHPSSNPRTPSECDEEMPGTTQACPACTFENAPETLACTICDTLLNPDTLL